MAVYVNEIGNQLCKALGLDASKVLSISFDWEAGDVARIFIEMPVDEEMCDNIVSVISQYELHHVGQKCLN